MNRLFRVLVPQYFKSGMSLDAPALLNNEGPGPRVPQALVSAGLRAGYGGSRGALLNVEGTDKGSAPL